MIKKFIALFNQKTFLTFTFLLAAGWQVFLFFRLRNMTWAKGLLSGWFTANNLTFYKDFLDTYPPLLPFLLLPFHLLTQFDLRVTIFAFYIVILLTLFLLYHMAKNILYLGQVFALFCFLFFGFLLFRR